MIGHSEPTLGVRVRVSQAQINLINLLPGKSQVANLFCICSVTVPFDAWQYDTRPETIDSIVTYPE